MDRPPFPDPAPARSLSLVLPAYNEEAGIRRAVAEADEALAGLGYRYEVLIVDDGSRDRTAALVEQEAADRPAVRLLRHPENRGYGAALRTGFAAARFDRVAFTDADCQFDLTDLASLVPLTDQHPVAAGYRLDRQDSWLRRFYSWGYNVLVRTLLGTRVRDCDCALKVFRRETLTGLMPESPGFFVNAEMLTRARQLGHPVAEAGVRHRPRAAGHSKVSLRDIPRVLGALLPFWWTQVLFAAEPQRTEEKGQQSGPLSSALCVLAVLLMAGLLFFSRLSCPLLEPDEARYAEIPRQMLAEGRWVVPVLHGEPYFHKPPLLYWLVMATYSVFGVHDWAARLIPGAAGCLVVLTAYLWARRTIGARAALAGALVLCLSARFVYLGRMLTMDGLLCLWVVAGWAAAHAAVTGTTLRRGWWFLSAIICGLGILTKGPVAVVLIAAPIIALQALDRRTARLALGPWLGYLAVAVGVAGPWFAAAAAAEPAGVSDFFWIHHVRRFLAPLDHEGPVWYYLPGLLLGMLPWTLLLPSMGRLLGRRSAAAARRRPAALGVYLLAFGWCLLFFSLAGSKRPGYILPAMPPLALALGCCLDRALPRRPLRWAAVGHLRRLHLLPYRATLLVLAAGTAAGFLSLAFGGPAPWFGLLLAGGAGGVLFWLLRRGPGGQRGVAWAGCGVATFLALWAAVYQLLPGYAHKFSLKYTVQAHRHLTDDPGMPVACYPRRWDSVSFYLGRNDVRSYSPTERARLIADLRARPETLVFVKTGAALDELLGQLPVTMEFVAQNRHPRVTVGLVRRREEVSGSFIAAGWEPGIAP